MLRLGPSVPPAPGWFTQQQQRSRRRRKRHHEGSDEGTDGSPLAEADRSGALALIGNTPLVRIRSLSEQTGCEVRSTQPFLSLHQCVKAGSMVLACGRPAAHRWARRPRRQAWQARCVPQTLNSRLPDTGGKYPVGGAAASRCGVQQGRMPHGVRRRSGQRRRCSTREAASRTAWRCASCRRRSAAAGARCCAFTSTSGTAGRVAASMGCRTKEREVVVGCRERRTGGRAR